MRRVWPLIFVALIPLAGCSSFETIPLADDDAVSEIQVPVPVARATAISGLAPVVEAAEPPAATPEPALPPRPVDRPATGSGSLEDQPEAAKVAVAALTEGLHQIGEMAIGTANAAEARPGRDVLFEEANFVSEGAAPPAAAPQEAPLDPEAVERHDVKAIEGCVNDVFRACPRVMPTEPAPATASLPAAPTEEIASATIGFVRTASIEPRTILWVMIGLAALLGLFLSARRSAE